MGREILHTAGLPEVTFETAHVLESRSKCRYPRISQAGALLSSYTILYYTILYYTTLYYVILYYTMLYCTKQTVLYYSILLYYTILYYTILYYTILYYTILYYTTLHYTVLYCTTLYYTLLYYSPHEVRANPQVDLALQVRQDLESQTNIKYKVVNETNQA